MISPLAGKPTTPDALLDITALERVDYERQPDVDDPAQLVSFGTSGHRGSSLRFCDEPHLNAILTEARQIVRNALKQGRRQ